MEITFMIILTRLNLNASCGEMFLEYIRGVYAEWWERRCETERERERIGNEARTPRLTQGTTLGCINQLVMSMWRNCLADRRGNRWLSSSNLDFCKMNPHEGWLVLFRWTLQRFPHSACPLSTPSFRLQMRVFIQYHRYKVEQL